jgi:hypothetical protein
VEGSEFRGDGAASLTWAQPGAAERGRDDHMAPSYPKRRERAASFHFAADRDLYMNYDRPRARADLTRRSRSRIKSINPVLRLRPHSIKTKDRRPPEFFTLINKAMRLKYFMF